MIISDRAKSFWAEQDVDQVFGAVFEYLDHLRETLKTSTASDKGSSRFLPLNRPLVEFDV